MSPLLPSPLRQAIRKEQSGIRVRAAASCNQQQHIISGFQRRLQVIEGLRGGDRVMVDAQNDIAVLNPQIGRESAWLEVRHQDPLVTVQMELVSDFLGLLVRKALDR